MAVEWWLSSNRMTISVSVDRNETIVDAAPIVRKFIGQPLQNLIRWMGHQGGLRIEKLGGNDESTVGR